MRHSKKPFRLDPMTALLVVVALGVALTMVAQASAGTGADEMLVAQQGIVTSLR